MQISLPITQRGVRIAELRRTAAGRVALILGATALVALCARLTVPLWFTPVPLTLENFAVLLVGLTLGPVDGFAAMALFLVEGTSGIPVFSPGPGGLTQLLGPSGGFLMAYPLVAATAGAISRAAAARRHEFVGAVVAGVAATLVLFAMGAAWFAHLLHLSAGAAFGMGVAPFLPGEVVKIAAAAGIYTSGKSLLLGARR